MESNLGPLDYLESLDYHHIWRVHSLFEWKLRYLYLCSRTIFRIGAFVECKCKVFFLSRSVKTFLSTEKKRRSSVWEKNEKSLFVVRSSQENPKKIKCEAFICSWLQGKVNKRKIWREMKDHLDRCRLVQWTHQNKHRNLAIYGYRSAMCKVLIRIEDFKLCLIIIVASIH